MLWDIFSSSSCPSGPLYFCTERAVAALIFPFVSPRGLWESAPSMSESAPTQRPVSRGQTCGLVGCVKHSDILQTPVSERCHTLAVIVMGGSGRLNQQAGDLYYAPQYVRWTRRHTHTVAHPLSQLSEKQQPTHTRINGRQKLHCVALHHFFLYMSNISSLFHHLITQSSRLSLSLLHIFSYSLGMNITWKSSHLGDQMSLRVPVFAGLSPTGTVPGNVLIFNCAENTKRKNISSGKKAWAAGPTVWCLNHAVLVLTNRGGCSL